MNCQALRSNENWKKCRLHLMEFSYMEILDKSFLPCTWLSMLLVEEIWSNKNICFTFFSSQIHQKVFLGKFPFLQNFKNIMNSCTLSASRCLSSLLSLFSPLWGIVKLINCQLFKKYYHRALSQVKKCQKKVSTGERRYVVERFLQIKLLLIAKFGTTCLSIMLSTPSIKKLEIQMRNVGKVFFMEIFLVVNE